MGAFKRTLVASLSGSLGMAGCLVLAFGSSACTKPNPLYQAIVVKCDGMRQDCIAEGVSIEGQVQCATYGPLTPFEGTACADQGANINDKCAERYCSQPAGVAYGYRGCSVTGTDVTSQIPADGTCRPTAGGDGNHLALVTYTRLWNDCTPAQGGGFCTSFTPNSVTNTECLDVSNTRALDALQPRVDTRDRIVNISSLALNWQTCPVIGQVTDQPSSYSMALGSLGTALANGSSTPMVVKSGFATIDTSCDGNDCQTTLDRFVVNMADTTVAGAQVSSVAVSTVSPISFGGNSIPTGVLRLLVTGRINGADTSVTVENHAPWSFSASATAFHMSGPLDMTVTDASGKPLPITIPVNLNGTPANAQTLACADMSSLKRLWGFEDPGSWRSSNSTLSLVTSPITQGCGALGVNGQNFIIITGAPFSTSGLAVNNALSVDLFIPNNQPNQFFLGNLQVALSCPSGGVNNQFIGQVALTGHTQNAFSTLRFPLPSATISTLRQPLNDCFFTWGLNVNQTGKTWIMDNLRFTP